MPETNNPYSYQGTSHETRLPEAVNPLLYWIPEEQVTLHDGRPLPSWMTFLHFPPPEIGRIRSAATDNSRHLTWSVFSIVFIPAVLIGSAIGVTEKSVLIALWAGMIVIGCVLLLGAFFYLFLYGIAYLKCLFKIRLRWQLCSFVGEEGYAVWYQDRILPKEETCEFVLFSKVKELDWLGLRDEQGGLVLNTYHAMLRRDSDNYKDDSLLRAIEYAWHVYFYFQWLLRWTENRCGELKLSKSDKLIFQPQEIVLQRDEKQLQIVSADVVKLAFTYDGQLMFYLAEEKLPENHGRLKYWLQEMPNCLATMGLIAKILNVPLTGQQLPFPFQDRSGPPKQVFAN